MSSKFLKSIDELCGIGSTDSFGLGWWTITFPGISIPPWTVNGHYHIDGSNYQHYPFSRNIGLIPMMFFSDVLISGGGTTVVEGSHLEASNILFEAGLKGCGSKELNNKVTEYCFENESNIVELTGNIGDIVFMHPFLLHARSTNISPVNLDSVRVLCHPTISLKNNMNFCKPFSELSIVEQSIVLSLVDDEASFFDEINSNLDYTSSLSNPRLNLVNSITPLNCEKYLNEIINLKRKHDLL